MLFKEILFLYLFVKHFGKGWSSGIERFHVNLVKSGNTADERSFVFTEFPEPHSSQAWKSLLGLTCGQKGVSGARHSWACLGCGETTRWEVVPFVPLLPWSPGPFRSLRIPNTTSEGPLWSRGDLVSVDSRQAGTRVRILQCGEGYCRDKQEWNLDLWKKHRLRDWTLTFLSCS